MSGFSSIIFLHARVERPAGFARGIEKLDDDDRRIGLAQRWRMHGYQGAAICLDALRRMRFLPADAERIAQAGRSHWEVENRLHWCLDVQFNDDQSRERTGFAANNLAIIRHIVIDLVHLNTSRKASIKTKRLLAASSDQFRAEQRGFTA